MRGVLLKVSSLRFFVSFVYTLILVIFILIRLSVTPVTTFNPNGGFNPNLFYFILVIIIFILGFNFYKHFFTSFLQYFSSLPLFQSLYSKFTIAETSL